MERRNFKVGDLYRICTKCQEWVPAKEQRCDRCHAFMQMTDFYEVEEADMIPQETNEDSNTTDENPLRMRCNTCKQVFRWGQYTTCPQCNEVLVMEMESSPQEDAELHTTMPKSQMSNEEVSYCYTVYRYSHGKEVASRQQRIPFEESETGFGRRNFTSDPRLFFDCRTEKIDRFYSCISTDNAIIRQVSGRLSIEHIPGKSVIRLNGIALRNGEKKDLHDGDLLRFGNGTDKEHMIDVHIYKIKSQANETNDSRWEGMMQELQKIRESSEATQERLNKIESVIESINPEDLRIRSNENPEEFDKRMDQMVPEIPALSMEEEILQFLQIKRPDGTIVDCGDQLQAVHGRKQIVSYLYQAAFLEKACASMEKEHQDYSAVLNSIGRAYEEFICTEVLSLVYKADGEDFEVYIKKNNLREDALQQGRILNYLLWRGKKCQTKNDWSKEGDVRIYNIVRASNYGNDEKRFWECRNAIQNVKYATSFRNSASHAQAAGDTRKENLKQYIQENKHKALSEEEYLKQKEQIFTSKGLSILHRYYQRACENENS